jgi:hypothetical protein
MLREVSSDKAKKSVNLQFEAVYGGQGSFAGISFDRYLPTTIVVVSLLVTFNFFRSHNLRFSSTHFTSFFAVHAPSLTIFAAK